MAEYKITWSVAYEGEQHETCNSLEEVLEWLGKNRSRFEFSLDNVTLRGPVGEMDVYGLCGRRDAGLPLIDPDYEAAATDLLAVLSDIERGKVCGETIERLDRVRGIVDRLSEARDAPAP